MNEFSQPLKPFVRRIRLVRGWVGLAMGATFGALGASLWATADYFGWQYADEAQLVALVAGSAVLGALINALRPISERAVAVSLERRTGLEERLSTAQERAGSHAPFDDALLADAHQRLQTVSPRTAYPFRWGQWHTGTLALSAVAAAVFLLGNRPLLMDARATAARETVKKEGQRIERVRKENLETPEAMKEMSDAERRLAEDMRRLQRDLEKARMSPEEARQKANEIGQKANEMMQEKAKATLQQLGEAESLREQMTKEALKQAGAADLDPQMAEMSPQARKAAIAEAEKNAKAAQARMDEIQRKLDEIEKQLKNPNLSAEARKQLEELKRQLQQEKSRAQEARDRAKEEIQQLKLSAQAMETFAKLMNDPEFQEIQKLAAQLAKNAKAGANGERPPLSKEELEQLRERLEALAKQLEDPEAMKAYLDALREALKGQLGQCRLGGVGFGLCGLSMGMNGPGGPGSDTDRMTFDSGQVPKSDKPQPGQGKALPTGIKGQIRQTPGEDPYIEIKAPTTVGNRTSIPYVKVLPSYRKKAESALDRQQIPKEHEKRVREYFSTLGK